MGKAKRVLGTTTIWLAVLALAFGFGFGTVRPRGAQATVAQESWYYSENNGYGCLSRAVQGVQTGHYVCGGQVSGQWYDVESNGSVWLWNGNQWVSIYWVQTDGFQSYASVYNGNVLVLRTQLIFYTDGSIGMVEIYPQDLRYMDTITAASATAATFSGYTGSQMFSGLYNAAGAGPII